MTHFLENIIFETNRAVVSIKLTLVTINESKSFVSFFLLYSMLHKKKCHMYTYLIKC